jgi:ubiquinone/menaquinone biosynthesis C-methylase UbiE
MKPDNQYTQMQLSHYNSEASKWSVENPDAVVGSFHQHNNWEDYKYLFDPIKNPKEKIVLDFACGPCRNIAKHGFKFKRMDGVDISPINIENAKKYLDSLNITGSNLYISNGVDLDIIKDNSYDAVISSIALQHICVYDIRYSIFKEIYRVLAKDGIFSAQMGFGHPSPYTVDYYENYYNAPSTNRACDVCVASESQLEKDLLEIGFKDFQFTIRPVGPGDCHPNWIFFNVKK